MLCFYWADGKGSHAFPSKNIAFLPKFWLFKISSGRKEKEKLQFHFCGRKASVGTWTLKVRDSQHAIQGHSWIQFSPSTATKLHLSKRKAFSLKQRVKFLLVGKQPFFPTPTQVKVVFCFFLTRQKFQIFSERCLFYFQIIYKPRLFQPTPMCTAAGTVVSEHGAYQQR